MAASNYPPSEPYITYTTKQKRGMRMVQRYNQGDYCGGEYPCHMESHDEGKYVKWEDYEKLQAENERLEGALQDLRSEIDEDNEHDAETCGDRGDCLVCMINQALKGR